MSVDVLMKWVERFQNSKKLGHLDSISQDRIDEYFGWLDHLIIHIECWKQMIAIGEIVKSVIAKEGFSHETYQKLEDLLNEQFPDASPKLINFIDSAMNAVWDEAEQLKAKQVVLGDSRVIESVFGKFKQSSSSQFSD
jgi:DNA phosphorothioation-dependent restriction protein DptG